MRSFEKKIKENRHKDWIEKIVQMYGEFLEFIGE